jgi:hypothetical protein
MRSAPIWLYLLVNVLSWIVAFVAARHLQERRHRQDRRRCNSRSGKAKLGLCQFLCKVS